MRKYDWTTFIVLREIATTVIAILLIVVMFGIIFYKANETSHDERTCVVSCTKESEDIYEVVVQDHEGNEWAYYDDMPRENGAIIVCSFNERNEIIDAR